MRAASNRAHPKFLHINMLPLRLAPFIAATAATSVGPCFGWSAALLAPYGLQSIQAWVAPPALPDNAKPSV
jgi:hypothetical protein